MIMTTFSPAPPHLKNGGKIRLRLGDYELVEATDSTPQSCSLSLTLKSPARPEILERCEDDARFLFEIENHQLIAMACDILDKLDPVTNEQVVEKIRKLVSDQG